MVIGAVDHSGAHILARQLFCSFKPAKTRANDDDVRFSCGGVFHTASFRQRSTSNPSTSNIQFGCRVALSSADLCSKLWMAALRTAHTTAESVCPCYGFVYASALCRS